MPGRVLSPGNTPRNKTEFGTTVFFWGNLQSWWGGGRGAVCSRRRAERQAPGTGSPFSFCDWRVPSGNQALRKYLMTMMNRIKVVRLQRLKILRSGSGSDVVRMGGSVVWQRKHALWSQTDRN